MRFSLSLAGLVHGGLVGGCPGDRTSVLGRRKRGDSGARARSKRMKRVAVPRPDAAIHCFHAALPLVNAPGVLSGARRLFTLAETAAICRLRVRARSSRVFRGWKQHTLNIKLQ
ncbi:hypothetical protein GCM10010412_096880 [Nonomuraea recticatena]|uniref:Secreted protein n=1 Tax=Nonomuraea recticatena TaxID=46178 RepID=A0ABP6FTN9_9ACTN